MRVAIVGSRDYASLEHVEPIMREMHEAWNAEFISGGARGVDQEAERVADKLDLPITVIKADWDAYGKAAGMIRNRTIVEAAHKVIAFWDGRSKGTRNVIGVALKSQTDLEVVFP